MINEIITKDTVYLICMSIYRFNNEDDEKESKEIGYDRNSHPIKIFLNTRGGDVYESLAIVGAIQASITPVEVIALGYAMSGGFLIFVSCHKRLCQKYTTFLYHDIRSWIEGTVSTMEEELNEIKRLQRIVDNIVINTTNVSQETLDKYNNKKEDWYINAEDALKLGIVDEII